MEMDLKDEERCRGSLYEQLLKLRNAHLRGVVAVLRRLVHHLLLVPPTLPLPVVFEGQVHGELNTSEVFLVAVPDVFQLKLNF